MFQLSVAFFTGDFWLGVVCAIIAVVVYVVFRKLL